MQVLVTGAAGFIGANVTERLLADGHTVAACDDLNDAYDPRLKDWRLARLMQHPAFSFHRVDIRDRDDVARLFRECRPEAVYNLAARAGVHGSVVDPWIYLETNAHGTLNLLEACRIHDVGRILLASTSSLYGAHNPLPFAEDADTSRPLSPYAASKRAAESLTAAYHHLYGMATPVVRYFTVYGPAGRPDMSVFRFIRWIAEGEPVTIYGDGSQSRDFTYVDDIARGTLLVGQQVKGFEVVNLGGDAPHRLDAVLARIEEALDRKAQIVHQPVQRADVPATWADVTRARGYGWEPEVGIEEGIRRSVAWYVENREWARGLLVP